MSFWESVTTEESINIKLDSSLRSEWQSKNTRSVGIEPTTHGFGDHCSADELRPYNIFIIQPYN